MTARIILITGANKGVGFGIAQSLGLRSSDDTLLVTSRALSAAKEAIVQLQKLGVKAPLKELQLDVTKDESIKAAVAEIQRTYGKLDVLVNNAGIALNPSESLSDFRQVYNSIFDTNVTSVGLVTSHFLPLLKQSQKPVVINVSSELGSMAYLTAEGSSPTKYIAYSASKAALNAMTVEMAKEAPDVAFHLVSPGHCKTALNNYVGRKDPLIGAEVVTELIHGQFEPGFWHKDRELMKEIAW